MRVRIVAVVVVLLAVLAGVAGGLAIWSSGDSDGVWADLRDRLGIDASGTDTVEGSGFIEGTAVTVGAEMGAQVAAVRVKDGDAVDRDAVLVELDSPSLAAQRRQVEAALEAAEAGRDRVRAGARPDQIRSLETALEASRSAASDAERAWQDAQTSGASAVQVDAARTRSEVAQAAVAVAEAQIELARAGASSYQLAAADASVAQARARLAAIDIQVAHLSVRAPLTGTVTSVVARAGETVAAGSVLAQVTRLDPLELTIYVAEDALADVEVGQSAEVTVDSFADDTFDGEVVAIATEAEFTPKNVQTKENRADLVFAVRIRLPNRDGKLRPGMPADAKIDVS
jgi:HlyD family secretion protein